MHVVQHRRIRGEEGGKLFVKGIVYQVKYLTLKNVPETQNVQNC